MFKFFNDFIFLAHLKVGVGVRENVMYMLSFENFVNESPVDGNEQKFIVIYLI